MKIKMGFDENIKISERKSKLRTWAKGVNRVSRINILEEKHFARMSYIVIENPKCN